MKKPVVKYEILESGAHLLRFSDINDLFWYDKRENNPSGISIVTLNERETEIERYLYQRSILTGDKLKMIERAKHDLNIDRDFLELVYKGKSDKRERILNKFGGTLSMAHYASQGEKFFHKFKSGAKKKVLNLAFQVGNFVYDNYEDSFIKILKTIMMAQSLGINLNIDMFDSDTNAIANESSYIIVNVAKSYEKIDFRKILSSSHRQFFNYSLFNGYSASKCQRHIGTFLSYERIVKDLGPMYDIIGGNMLSDTNDEMVSKILKIGMKM